MPDPVTVPVRDADIECVDVCDTFAVANDADKDADAESEEEEEKLKASLRGWCGGVPTGLAVNKGECGAAHTSATSSCVVQCVLVLLAGAGSHWACRGRDRGEITKDIAVGQGERHTLLTSLPCQCA